MDALSHALAGAVGGVIAMAALYPLENVRTRLQVQVEQRKRLHATPSAPSTTPLPPEHYHGTFDCIARVSRAEGWRSLYTGLASALVGVGVSSAVYFFWYHLFRSRLLRLRQRSSLPALDNLLVASVAGALNIMCTLPIWVINTRITLASPHHPRYSSILHTFRTILREEGVRGLYKGLLPSLILVSNPAIQFLAYEQLVRLLSAYYRRRHQPTPLTLTSVPTLTANTEVRVEVGGGGLQVPVLSSVDFFVLGAVSKAVATVLTYPYQVVRTRLMGEAKRQGGGEKGEEGEGGGVWEMRGMVRRMLAEEGVHSFFQGIEAKLTQTVLNSALMFVVYEKIVEAIRVTLHEAYEVEQSLQHKTSQQR